MFWRFQIAISDKLKTYQYIEDHCALMSIGRAMMILNNSLIQYSQNLNVLTELSIFRGIRLRKPRV